MKEIILAAVGVALLAAAKSALASYRAGKKPADIVADAAEAAIDTVEKK